MSVNLCAGSLSDSHEMQVIVEDMFVTPARSSQLCRGHRAARRNWLMLISSCTSWGVTIAQGTCLMVPGVHITHSRQSYTASNHTTILRGRVGLGAPGGGVAARSVAGRWRRSLGWRHRRSLNNVPRIWFNKKMLSHANTYQHFHCVQGRVIV